MKRWHSTEAMVMASSAAAAGAASRLAGVACYLGGVTGRTIVGFKATQHGANPTTGRPLGLGGASSG